MEFTIEAAGARTVRMNMLRYAENILDPEPLFEAIANRMEGYIEQRFAHEGQFMGQSKWKRLKPETIARKRALGYAEPETALFATGKLKQSFRQGQANNYRLVDRNEVTVGSLDPVARFHNAGTSNLPKRQITRWSAEMRLEIAKRFQNYIVTGDPRPPSGYAIASF